MRRRARTSKATARGKIKAAQRVHVLKTLRRHTGSTIELRHHLDILAPAARIYELRKEGHDIVTLWDRQQTRQGRFHRVALYMLLSKGVAR